MSERHRDDAPCRVGKPICNQLQKLDALIPAVKKGLGPGWSDTLIVVATAFGRTVAINGTIGIDHGTASALMLFGGSLPSGAKVTADCPGLSVASLDEGRNLKPTVRIENIIGDALAKHYA